MCTIVCFINFVVAELKPVLLKLMNSLDVSFHRLVGRWDTCSVPCSYVGKFVKVVCCSELTCLSTSVALAFTRLAGAYAGECSRVCDHDIVQTISKCSSKFHISEEIFSCQEVLLIQNVYTLVTAWN